MTMLLSPYLPKGVEHPLQKMKDIVMYLKWLILSLSNKNIHASKQPEFVQVRQCLLCSPSFY